MLLDPRLYPGISNKTIYQWRQFLKENLLKQRQYKSDLSGKALYKGCDVHEGIITRGMVNKSVKWHYFIFHPINCFLLLPDEHSPIPPTKDKCYELACHRYGKEYVLEWLDSLPFKCKPRNWS